MCVSNTECKSVVEQVNVQCCLKFKNRRDIGLKVHPDRNHYEYYDGTNGTKETTNYKRSHPYNCVCRDVVKYARILYE